jgi:hypothetical protein
MPAVLMYSVRVIGPSAIDKLYPNATATELDLAYYRKQRAELPPFLQWYKRLKKETVGPKHV